MLIGKGTATNSFQTLAAILEADGLSAYSNGGTMQQNGYLKNTDTAINLYVGSGASSPSTYGTLVPTDQLLLAEGTNLNEVWVKSASSTVVVNLGDGAVYQNSSINGVVGDIVATENQVPKADADGNLVASSISDDGTTVVVDEDFDVTGDSALEGALAVSGETSLGNKIAPSANDGAALGDTTHNFSDICMATGSVYNVANGNWVMTHTSGIQTVGTGDLRVTNAGSNTASVVTVGGSQVLTGKTLTGPAVNAPTINSGAALGTTSTEIDRFNDVSAYQESIVAAGALSVSKLYSGLSLVGAGAVTLAAPDGTMIGQVKTIEMIVDNGDVTLSLANVVGGTAATTCTWTNAGESLVLLAAFNKWIVIKQFGVVLS